jgi:hypothetical protein
MAKAERPELSSVFDDMLAQNKKRLDGLYGSGGPRANASSAPVPAAGGWKMKATTSQPPARLARLGPDSPAARRLNERFGDDWRYEIVEQKHDGDEAIVLCKLIFGREAAVRTQFGRAKISHGPTAGASGAVRFKLDVAGEEAGEAAAFRRATEAALSNCADLV